MQAHPVLLLLDALSQSPPNGHPSHTFRITLPPSVCATQLCCMETNSLCMPISQRGKLKPREAGETAQGHTALYNPEETIGQCSPSLEHPFHHEFSGKRRQSTVQACKEEGRRALPCRPGGPHRPSSSQPRALTGSPRPSGPPFKGSAWCQPEL